MNTWHGLPASVCKRTTQSMCFLACRLLTFAASTALPADRALQSRCHPCHLPADPLAGKEAAAARRCLTVLKQVRCVGLSRCGWLHAVHLFPSLRCLS